MKFTLDWLKAPLDTTASLNEITDKLTAIGLEVEGIEDKAKLLAPFTVAYIKEAVQHPDADRLRVCTVDTGSETLQIVCGAPNARAGIKVVLSRPGDYIPGLDKTISLGKIRGIESQGMLCAADELGLGDDHAGILELPESAPVGAKLLDVMPEAGTVVIEINLTPNRGDCAGVYGIARDLAAAGLGTLKPLPMAEGVPAAFDNPYKVVVEDHADCPAFALRLIRGVKNTQSPAWLRGWLEAIGVTPISALVDITNFLTFDLARPLHVFDAAKVHGQTLTIRRAKAGETLEALNNKTYTLSPEVLVIADDQQVESIAGVMGGLASGCAETTTDVLVECALFNPERVAMAGRLLQINSDARYRFERGVDPASLTYGMDIATRMILDICGGSASSVVTTGTADTAREAISYKPARFAHLTGVELAGETQKAIFEKLGCTVSGSGDTWQITPPSWRPDLTIAEDMVEEALRLHGYDHIPATPLPVAASAVALDPKQRRNALARRTCAAQGLSECVTWSFMPPALAAEFAPANEALALVNPISVELSQMRPSIVGNLLQAAQRNAAHGQGDTALFEVGPVYKDPTPKGQETVATGLRTGAAVPASWQGKAQNASLFDIKADLAVLLEANGLSIDNVPLGRDAPGYYHPGRSFALRLGANVIAYAGELHPRLTEAHDLRHGAVAFELFLDRLPLPKKTGAARPLLKLPSLQAVTRDFAFLVPADAPADTLLKAIRKAEKDTITDVTLFDIYQDEARLPGQKSLALTVTLQPKGDTAFTDKDLEALSQKIVAVAEKAGVTLRS